MKLWANTRGAWRLVLSGLTEQQMPQVRVACAALSSLGRLSWRLTEEDGMALAYCEAGEWSPARLFRRLDDGPALPRPRNPARRGDPR